MVNYTAVNYNVPIIDNTTKPGLMQCGVHSENFTGKSLSITISLELLKYCKEDKENFPIQIFCSIYFAKISNIRQN